MRAALRRLIDIAVAVTVAVVAVACSGSTDARVESTAAIGAGAQPVPGTEVSLTVPDGFALDARAQTVACTDRLVCGDTSLYIAWRNASASRDPAELFAEEIEGQLRNGHARTEVRIGDVAAVRLDAAPATVNPGEVMRDYRLRVGARTVRFHLAGHLDHRDAFEALGRAVEGATLLRTIAPIDRGWTLAGDLGLQVQESSPDYALVGTTDRPSDGEAGLAIAYACYGDPKDAAAPDDRHRQMATQLLRAQGVETSALTTVTVDGLAGVEAQGSLVGGLDRQAQWTTIVFRADRPLVLSTEHDPTADATALDRYHRILAGLRMTGTASTAACS